MTGLHPIVFALNEAVFHRLVQTVERIPFEYKPQIRQELTEDFNMLACSKSAKQDVACFSLAERPGALVRERVQ